MTAAEILIDLVAIPSVSSMSNRAVIDYARRRLTQSAWMFREYEHAEGKVNLVATSGEGVAGLALVCHTDTVPYDEAWPEAVHPVERDFDIYGRGSADVKGFLACILAAVEGKPVERFAQPLAIVLTADEEVGCLGAKHLAAQKAFRAEHAIVGEPTSLTPIRGGKGYGLGQIVVRGKEAHSAFPAQGRSAIYDAARVIAALERVAKDLEDEPNGEFDPPFTTLNVGLIEGGTAKNIVAGECRLTVEWRPVPGQDAEFAPALIRHELMRLQVLSGVSADFEVLRTDPPFAPSASEDLAELLQALTRIPPSTVAFGTEAAHIAALADDVVVFGPGSMSTAHQSGEHVPVVQLDYCVRFLQAAMARYCAIPNEERS